MKNISFKENERCPVWQRGQLPSEMTGVSRWAGRAQTADLSPEQTRPEVSDISVRQVGAL